VQQSTHLAEGLNPLSAPSALGIERDSSLDSCTSMGFHGGPNAHAPAGFFTKGQTLLWPGLPSGLQLTSSGLRLTFRSAEVPIFGGCRSPASAFSTCTPAVQQSLVLTGGGCARGIFNTRNGGQAYLSVCMFVCCSCDQWMLQIFLEEKTARVLLS